MGVISKVRQKVKDRVGRFIYGMAVKGGWSGLFAIAAENKLFRNQLTQPYKQISNVFKAVKAIADNVPKAELQFKDRATGDEVYPDDLVGLFERPNPFMTGADFNQAVAGYIALYGEVIIVKTKSKGQVAGTYGLPAELWPFNPDKFEQVKGKDPNTGRDTILYWKTSTERFELDEICHIKDWNPYNPLRGLAPTEAIKEILEIDWKSLMYNKVFFDNDASPGSVLLTDSSLEEDQVERYRQRWAKVHRGASKAHKVAILDGGMQLEQFASASHKDMEFMEQKKFTREEILGIWRAPKALFNITEDLNYATFVGQMKIFWLYGIMPILEKMCQAYTIYIVHPYNDKITCEFDASKAPAFQEDFKDKVETAKRLTEIGFTRNEVNDKLKLGFDENDVWGDKYLVPFNLVDVEDIISGDAGKAAEPVSEDEEKAAEDAINKEMDEKDRKAWGAFVKQHLPNELLFQKAVKSYFYVQRGRVLNAVDQQLAQKNIKISLDFVFDWEGEKDLYKRRVNVHLKRAAKSGASYAESFLESELDPDVVDTLIARTVKNRTELSVTTIETQKGLVNKAIDEGLLQGGTITEIAANIKDNIRKVYNNAASRARVIARTETTAAMNTATESYYREAGVERKQWLTAGDEAVRETHKNLNSEVVDIDEQFSNGLAHPGGEGPASETINCRCTLIPVIE